MTARAGAGGRYLYDYVQIMGIDMTQFDQMGYKLVGGEKPVKRIRCLPANGSPMVSWTP